MSKLIIENLANFEGHKSSIYALEGMVDSRYFFSGSADGMVVQWDVESKENGKLLASPPERIYLKPLDFSPLK